MSFFAYTNSGNPGAVRGSLQESAINLAIATHLQRQLEAYPAQHKVIMTRDTDEAVSLDERVRIANKAGAAYFVSIHCNAADDPEAHGVEVYYYHGSTKGKTLAGKVHRMVKPLYTNDRGIKEGNFEVIRETHMPAILAECGFVSNPKEARMIGDERFQISVAKAIASAIRQEVRSVE
jgi:N-acetylmuramoyl-L-alanine amidase